MTPPNAEISQDIQGRITEPGQQLVSLLLQFVQFLRVNPRNNPGVLSAGLALETHCVISRIENDTHHQSVVGVRREGPPPDPRVLKLCFLFWS